MKLLCALFMAGGLVSAGQQQQPTFKAQAPLVVVPVTVSAKDGERIWNLQPTDFELLDNGEPRPVTVEPWGTYQSHVSLVVVIETGTMSRTALLKVKKIPSMLDNIVGEDGEVAVVTADSEIETRLPFTKQWEPIQETFEKLPEKLRGAGRVLDGVDAAITLLSEKPKEQRRLILLLSEPHDRGSKAKASDVLTRAQQENVTIYTASYNPYVTPFTTKASEVGPDPYGGLNYVTLIIDLAQSMKASMGKTLAQYTGGRQLSFLTLKGLEADLTEIGKEVHSQYQLSFVPLAEQTAVYHAISIKVKDHPEAVIRARPGYWSGASINEAK